MRRQRRDAAGRSHGALSGALSHADRSEIWCCNSAMHKACQKLLPVEALALHAQHAVACQHNQRTVVAGVAKA